MGVAYTTFQDIQDDVLFRGSEHESGTEYDEQVKRYILRAYSSVLYGDADLIPNALLPDWGWLRVESTILLDADNNPTGRYDLPDDFDSLDHHFYTTSGDAISVVGFNQLMDNRVARTQQNQLNETPFLCALTRDTDMTGFQYQVIFDANGPPGETITLTYSYNQLQDVETWRPDDSPNMPIQYRKILADYALYFLMFDKDDDRATTVGLLVQNTLRQMVRTESRRRVPTDSAGMGQLVGGGQRRRAVRTRYNLDSGLRVGR